MRRDWLSCQCLKVRAHHVCDSVYLCKVPEVICIHLLLCQRGTKPFQCDIQADFVAVLEAVSNRSGHAVYFELVFIPAMNFYACLLYTSPSPRDGLLSRMP